MTLSEQIEAYITKEQDVEEEKQYISFGNALADVIVGGGAGPVGKFLQISAPSGAGKSIICTEVIYQAKVKFGEKVSVRYLDKEGGNTFDTERMYGFSLEEDFVHDVDTVEELSADLYNFAKQKPSKNIGIYVVDSWDSLSSQDEMSEMEERAKYHEKGKEYTKKRYGAERAKFASQLFRTLIKTLRENNILLIAISQLRDNINAGMFGPKDSISGGRSLEFYADQRLSLRVREIIEEEGRMIGQTVEFKALKSRCPYPRRSMYLTFLTSSGVDSVGTNVDYLYDLRDERGKLKEASAVNNIPWKDSTKEVSSASLKAFLEEQGHLEEATEDIKTNGLRMTQNNIVAWIRERPEVQAKFVEEFGVLDRESLIQHIIHKGLEQEISDRTVAKWLAIEEAIKPQRPEKRI